MAGPNLLEALRAHLATGELPETLRATLQGDGVRTVPIEQSATPLDSGFASPPQRPRASAPLGARQSMRASSQKLDISALEEGAGNQAQAEAFQPRVTPAGEVEPPLPWAPTKEHPFEKPPAQHLNRATARRLAREDEGLEGFPPEALHGLQEAIGVTEPLTHRVGDYMGQPRGPRLTTDDTLAEDLAASLALGADPREGAVDALLGLTHHPTCTADYPEKPEGEGPQHLLRVDLEDGTGGWLWQCADCGATSDPQEVDPAAEATLGVSTSVVDCSFEHPTYLSELPQFAYVSGAAGVGKTYWAKELARNSGDAVVLCATTGIASVNLGEGTTINTLLKYYDTASLREAYTGGYLEAMLKKHRATGLERILLDEVSMMAGEQLTILTRAIDNVNADKPEGVPEMGLILLGDFAQLAPVPDRDPKDPKGFKKLPVQFAFESAEWDRYEANTLKLTRIRRQADQDFIEALQATRRGAVGAAAAYFGPRMVPATDMNFQGPTIVAKNDAVQKYNQLRLDAVKGASVGFPSARWGKVRPEWGANPKPKPEWGVPEVLQLKEGCRVMILANKNIGLKDEPPVWAYTNGDLGTFLEPLRAEGAAGAELLGARVRLDRTGSEVSVGYLTRTNDIPLEPGRRKALKAEGHPERVSDDGKREFVGGVTYVPLRLAYCTTVHKSQGLSLDQVQINIRDPFFAQPGMLYVALSRARSVEGLRLVGNEAGFRARCTVNPKLKGYL